MSTFADAATLAVDPDWQARIAAAVTFVACEIGLPLVTLDSPTEPEKRRLILARSILADVASAVPSWSYLVAVQGVVLTDADSDIQFQVDLLWSLVAGVGG